ncbi:MAG: hypothetical protein ACHQ1E_07285 [Ktedonobacterales bacterium]|jgi:hypothetical protein
MSKSTTKPDHSSSQMEDQRRQSQIERNQAVIALLNAWEQEDPEEQRETLDLLMRTLDEDRPSSRKLFEQ